MEAIVIGYGEIGKAVAEVFKIQDWIDITKRNTNKDAYDILHVSIPYSSNFADIVNDYIDVYKPIVTIVHSTVAIGTMSKIKGDRVHAPVRGRHDKLALAIMTFTMHISSNADPILVRNYFEGAGINIEFTFPFEVTEAAKLLSLLQYGMNIEFARYAESICSLIPIITKERAYKLAIEAYTRTYNKGVFELEGTKFFKPILSPPKGKIGGHCVLPAIKILNEQVPDNILKGILEKNNRE